MKYLNSCAAGFLLVGLLGLGGCRGPTTDLTTVPIASTPQTQTLDPEKAENVAVYFFTDHPVHGLNFYCTSNGAVALHAMTDETGRAVCPRAGTITFYIGDINTPASVLVLGSVDLRIYGATSSGANNARNYVTVTPSTLSTQFPTVANSSNDNSVPNIFNLLYTLDVVAGSGYSARHVIQLPEDPLLQNIHVMFTQVLVDNPSLLAQHGGSPLTMTPASFVTNFLQPVISALNVINAAFPNDQQQKKIQFVHAGSSMSLNPSDPDYLLTVADNAVVASHAGIYRAAGSAINDNSGQKVMSPSAVWLVTRHGDVQGLGADLSVDSSVSPAILTYLNMNMMAGAKFGSDGLLQNVNMLDDANTFRMDYTGRLVNGYVWSTVAGQDPTQNPLVPSGYTPEVNDLGKILADAPAVVAAGNGMFYGPIGISPDEATLPDNVDLGLLSAYPNLLPLTLLIGLKAYPDGSLATDTERNNSTQWVTPPVKSLQFTIEPNGEIVSDLDGNCNPKGVSYSNGSLTDVTSGNPEYVIGQVGPVIKDTNGNPYITLLLAVYGSQAQPAYGFALGFSGEYNTGQAVLYDVKDKKIISKTCDPNSLNTCLPPEWFNDYVYSRYILMPHIMQGVSLDPLSRSQQSGYYYYGRVDTTIAFGPVDPTATSCPPPA